MTKTATAIARGAGATGETTKTSMSPDQRTRSSTTIDLTESGSERLRCKVEQCVGSVTCFLYTTAIWEHVGSEQLGRISFYIL